MMDNNYISRDIHVVKRFFLQNFVASAILFISRFFAEFVCAELCMVCVCFREIHFSAKMQNPTQKMRSTQANLRKLM